MSLWFLTRVLILISMCLSDISMTALVKYKFKCFGYFLLGFCCCQIIEFIYLVLSLLSYTHLANIFSQAVSCLCCFNSVFQITLFFLTVCASYVLSNNSVLNTRWTWFFPRCSSRNFRVLCFTFRSIIHCEWILVHGAISESWFIIFSYICPNVPAWFLKRMLFPNQLPGQPC